MKRKNRPKLPRGLRWDPKSPYILFSWRDADEKLHQKSTEKTDPAEALLFKIRFLEQQKEKADNEEEPELSEYGNFRSLVWRTYTSNGSLPTVQREQLSENGQSSKMF
ncbi:MAG: hypothetical protein DMG65_04685 [Candidatus Angelobacter sp. Gp1-AA117]|nr:MAG: hypothetical protein DMG65_04685 [Candidatus Angelobacter sp. Gp1-AA117]